MELDRRLVPLLTERTKEFPSIHVVQGDILHLTPSALIAHPSSPLSRSYDVIGNIPYNITSKLLRHLLAWSPRPRLMTLLLDAAVATRIAASPPDMSILAVAIQVYAAPRVIPPRIPPSAFTPPPQVTSAVMQLKTRREPLIPPQEEQAFFRLVRAGFSQKRKTLTNALSASERMPQQDVVHRLRTAGIEPRRRAQTLSIDEWFRLLDIWTSA